MLNGQIYTLQGSSASQIDRMLASRRGVGPRRPPPRPLGLPAPRRNRRRSRLRPGRSRRTCRAAEIKFARGAKERDLKAMTTAIFGREKTLEEIASLAGALDSSASK